MIREHAEISVPSVKLIIKNRFSTNLALRSSANKSFTYVKVLKKASYMSVLSIADTLRYNIVEGVCGCTWPSQTLSRVDNMKLLMGRRHCFTT